MIEGRPTTSVLPCVPLHPTVVTALRAAGARGGIVPVDTRDLLVALMRADSSGSWHRVWLHCGDSDAVAGQLAIDPVAASTREWENIQLTGTCAVALEVAWRLAYRYNLGPLSAGIVAISLVADDSSAAAQALRAGGLTRDELLETLQSDILGVPLRGLDTVLPTVLAESQPTRSTNPPRVPAGPPPVIPTVGAVDPDYAHRRRLIDIIVVVLALLMVAGLAVTYSIMHHAAPNAPSGAGTSVSDSAPTTTFDLGVIECGPAIFRVGPEKIR